MSALVVLGHPRTGSNSLLAVLNQHPLVALLNEPFHENYASWAPGNPDYRARLRSGERIEDIFEEILLGARGMKEQTYHFDDTELAGLVAYPNVQVIALTRTNVLEQAVSQVIAEQTNLWKTWDVVGPLESHYRHLEPLDLDLVSDRMRWAAREVERLRTAVAALTPDHVFQLTYEGVFRSTRREQAAWLTRLWEFLGVPHYEDAQVWHYLGGDVRQARPDTYGNLPNLRQVEEALGDDSTGHLGLLTCE